MTNVRHIDFDKHGGSVRDRVELPWVPPGEYEARYRNHDTFEVFRSDKLCVFFTISDLGEGFGLTVPRFWNVTLTRHGFTAGTRSQLLREFCRLFPDWHPQRSDRVPISYFKGKAVRIRVQTVDTDRKQNPIPKQLHYSKVAKILEVLD